MSTISVIGLQDKNGKVVGYATGTPQETAIMAKSVWASNNTWTSTAEDVLKTAMIARVQDLRRDAEVNGVLIDGNIFATDTNSQIKYVAALQHCTRNSSFKTSWKTINNGFINIDANNISIISLTVLTYIQLCFSWEQAMLAKISKAITVVELTKICLTEGKPNGTVPSGCMPAINLGPIDVSAKALSVSGDAQVAGAVNTGSIQTTGTLIVSGNATLSGITTVNSLVSSGTLSAGAATVTSLNSSSIVNYGSVSSGSFSSTGTLTAGASTVTSLNTTSIVNSGTLTTGSSTVTSLNCTSIINTGTLSSGATTVASLNSGTLTAGVSTVTSLNSTSIVNTGTLSSGATSVTSLNSGSGAIATTGAITGATVTTTGITAAKKFKGNGAIPTIVRGAGSGTTSTVILTTGSTDSAGQISVATAGTITITAGTVIASVTFNTAYTSAPFVIIYPSSLNSGALQYQPFVTVTTTGFSISVSNLGILNLTNTYTWMYHVIQ